LVKDSRIAQISGKMLMARSRMIVGAMKIQAMALSESPRTRAAVWSGVFRAKASAALSMADGVVSVTV
jgi:hypothetical protein